MTYQPPPGHPSDAPPPGYPPPGYAPRPKNKLALASLIASIVSVTMCLGLFGFVGAILGHVARKQIRETGEDGDGLARVGIKIGWISFGIVCGIIVVVNVVGFLTSGR
ncbi:DUF4190 domain-containing protein [Cryptosporangium aurantiacum]|uniref:DUF4190 domain-containing protein n=1 Tax=Cryptosporangium aurantiacum TaxID=134849 RepID=A0A1M7R2L6_9ACTN|nr:DUF4190 domain-containing protein [Cryptosporangium aurantiacum]SHN39000.1 protein of unknown function [Cryptosporangium aurantiacum]